MFTPGTLCGRFGKFLAFNLKPRSLPRVFNTSMCFHKPDKILHLEPTLTKAHVLINNDQNYAMWQNVQLFAHPIGSTYMAASGISPSSAESQVSVMYSIHKKVC
jgi:hypothetical protein